MIWCDIGVISGEEASPARVAAKREDDAAAAGGRSDGETVDRGAVGEAADSAGSAGEAVESSDAHVDVSVARLVARLDGLADGIAIGCFADSSRPAAEAEGRHGRRGGADVDPPLEDEGGLLMADGDRSAPRTTSACCESAKLVGAERLLCKGIEGFKNMLGDTETP